MPIKKECFKTKPVCRVTFTIVAKAATEVSVVGNFNNWTSKNGTLSKLKNGNFKGMFELPTQKSYEFKYVVDGTFINEAEADGLVYNDFAGAENSVLIL